MPNSQSSNGQIIHDARNQIRIVDDTCVKRFQVPHILNRIVYSFFRKPKAERAYLNAKRLQELGIGTPEALEYTLCKRHGLLAESYLVTRLSKLQHTFYDFRDGRIAGREDLIRAFARFTAHVHDAGVLHLDYSPGNILYDRVDGEWMFELVDINRMRFGKVDARTGCRNFCRLWGKRDFFEILAPEYAAARGLDPEQCLNWILEAREQFWRHRRHDHFVSDDHFTVGVVVSTYNSPKWLNLCLTALLYQDHPADEVIIADDGSDEQTKAVIDSFRDRLPIRHIWHEDNGFRKTTILNKAVQAATADYLIFIDQDLIARRDFIGQHCSHARRGHFISGGAILMPEALSHALTREDIARGNVFSINWLKSHGMPWRWKMSKLWRDKVICRIMNALTPTNASWNGGNSSTWREYILAAKGFDERMRYGAEDREFGQRLENAGITGIQLRYGTPLMHLYHTRPYHNEQDWQENKKIWNETKANNITQTQHGIQ